MLHSKVIRHLKMLIESVYIVTIVCSVFYSCALRTFLFQFFAIHFAQHHQVTPKKWKHKYTYTYIHTYTKQFCWLFALFRLLSLLLTTYLCQMSKSYCSIWNSDIFSSWCYFYIYYFLWYSVGWLYPWYTSMWLRDAVTSSYNPLTIFARMWLV